jgi:hypothetical protein
MTKNTHTGTVRKWNIVLGTVPSGTFALRTEVRNRLASAGTVEEDFSQAVARRADAKWVGWVEVFPCSHGEIIARPGLGHRLGLGSTFIPLLTHLTQLLAPSRCSIFPYFLDFFLRRKRFLIVDKHEVPGSIPGWPTSAKPLHRQGCLFRLDSTDRGCVATRVSTRAIFASVGLAVRNASMRRRRHGAVDPRCSVVRIGRPQRAEGDAAAFSIAGLLYHFFNQTSARAGSLAGGPRKLATGAIGLRHVLHDGALYRSN